MLKRLSFILLLLACFTFINSCKTDFQVNDSYKEIDVVYGLLNIKDTIQYIRIEKAFLNNNNSAYTIAANMDSIYHKDTLKVVLEEYRNGFLNTSTSLYKIYNTNKDPGAFASPGQFLYRTPPGFKLYAASTYKIRVKDPKTGVEANASTAIVDSIQPGSPSRAGSINIPTDLSQYMFFSFYTGNHSRFYNVSIVFNYKEETNNDPATLRHDSVIFPLGNYIKTADLNGNATLRINVAATDFLSFLGNNIKADDHKTRFFEYPRIIIDGGGEEIYNYILIYTPAIGVVQKKNDYSNINNGQGVFSSRSHYEYGVPFNTSAKNVIKSSTYTAKLNFQ